MHFIKKAFLRKKNQKAVKIFKKTDMTVFKYRHAANVNAL